MVVQSTPMRSAPPMRQINIAVPVKVYDHLSSIARAQGIPVGTYARMLFNAAYTARVSGPTDVELDAAVGRVALLYGSQLNASQIAERVGIGESLVVKIIDAWRQELSTAKSGDV